MSCGNCNKGTRNGNTVACRGICDLSYHIGCVENLDDKIIKLLNENDNIAWFCDQCKPNMTTSIQKQLQGIYEVMSAFKNTIENHETMLEDITEGMKSLTTTNNNGTERFTANHKEISEDLKKIREEISSNKSEMKQNMQKLALSNRVEQTYADKLKSTAHKPKSNPVLIITPKNKEQQSADTEKAIKSKIDPRCAHVTNLRKNNSGSVIVTCKDSVEVNKLQKIANDRLGDSYEIKKPIQKFPKVKIVGLTEKMDTDEIIDCLTKQNEFLNNSRNSIKVLANNLIKNKYYTVIVEVDGANFTNIMEAGRVAINWDSCKVYEVINVKRCFKCWGFYHKAVDCKNKTACAKCGEEHKSTDCNSTIPKCINCKIAVEKLHLKIDTNHEAWNLDCPVYQKRIQQQKSKINYEDFMSSTKSPPATSIMAEIQEAEQRERSKYRAQQPPSTSIMTELRQVQHREQACSHQQAAPTTSFRLVVTPPKKKGFFSK